MDEGGWKVVARKSKDKGKQVAFQSVRTSVNYEMSGGGVSATAGVLRPN